MITRVTTDYTTTPYTETADRLFVGATLALHSNSTRIMSDVWENVPYATVFDAADGAVKIVWRGKGPAAVDATPDVLLAANAWLLAEATRRRKLAWDTRVGTAVNAAHKVAKGKTVIVVKGRKVPKGTTGDVIWVGEGSYFGPVPRYRGGWNTSAALRIGIKDAAGTVHWTAASNVEVVNADDYFDYDAFVTDEPDHAAEANAALDAPTVGRNGGKFSEVTLSAGEDRIGFSDWFDARTHGSIAA